MTELIDGHKADGAPAGNVILQARELKKYYPVKKGALRRTVGQVKAVDGVSFELHEGETPGVVGEPGCGKSTLGWPLVQLERPTEGIVELAGRQIKPGEELRRARRDIQIVFRDPYIAEPAHDGRRHRRRAAADPRQARSSSPPQCAHGCASC